MAEDPFDLPEYRDNPFINRLPPLCDHHAVLDGLTDLPAFDPAERTYPAHIRLHCLQRLTRYFDPNERHLDLDQRLDLMIRQGYVGRDPLTTGYMDHVTNGHARVVARDLRVSLRPAESTAIGMALIGVSGMGKTRSVQRILGRFTPQVIVHEQPFALHQVAWLRLDCPAKGSEKQLCFSFFKEMDRLLGTNFEARHGASREPVDKMLPQMAGIANRHALGLLVVDEIQHLIEAPGPVRRSLLNFFVTLVNVVGVPVLLIGTPRALPLLDGAFRQARRVSGFGSIMWDRLPPDETWKYFIKRMWRFQWTREPSDLTPEVEETLYDESQGIIDIVIKLYQLAQLKAIQLGAVSGASETIDAALLRHVAEESLSLVRPMLDALRKNDQRALERYDDLVGFDMYVKQILSDAAATIPRRSLSPGASAAAPVGGFPSTSTEADARIIEFLGQLGIAADIAPALIAEIRTQTPGIGPFEMLQAVGDRLRDRPPPTPPKRPRKPKAPDPAAPTDPADLRLLAAAGEGSAHARLTAGGALRRPAEEASLTGRTPLRDGVAVSA
ncbi:ATP-binding protein [Rubrimonas sp.]|uniref:ATP-binding protein n=1 Tax=Rubrimonas sp. TaxID=2036015 RepID=UPI002FDE9123